MRTALALILLAAGCAKTVEHKERIVYVGESMQSTVAVQWEMHAYIDCRTTTPDFIETRLIVIRKDGKKVALDQCGASVDSKYAREIK